MKRLVLAALLGATLGGRLRRRLAGRARTRSRRCPSPAACATRSRGPERQRLGVPVGRTGKTLQQMAEEVGRRVGEVGLAELGLHGRPGPRSRSAMIDKQGQFLYGPTAVYVAPSPAAPAKGPFVAPADVLLTEGRYRSAAGRHGDRPVRRGLRGAGAVRASRASTVLAVTKSAASTSPRRPGPGDHAAQDTIPEVGEHGAEGRRPTRSRRPRATSKLLDTRVPAERHAQGVFDQVRRQEARRAAVLDAAAVPVARLRAGDRRRAAAARPSTATRWSSSTRRSTTTTT